MSENKSYKHKHKNNTSCVKNYEFYQNKNKLNKDICNPSSHNKHTHYMYDLSGNNTENTTENCNESDNSHESDTIHSHDCDNDTIHSHESNLSYQHSNTDCCAHIDTNIEYNHPQQQYHKYNNSKCHNHRHNHHNSNDHHHNYHNSNDHRHNHNNHSQCTHKENNHQNYCQHSNSDYNNCSYNKPVLYNTKKGRDPINYHKNAEINIKNLHIALNDITTESRLLKLNSSHNIFSDHIVENLDKLIYTWENIICSIYKYKSGIEKLIDQMVDSVELTPLELAMNFKNFTIVINSFINEMIMVSKNTFTNNKNVFSIFVSRNSNNDG